MRRLLLVALAVCSSLTLAAQPDAKRDEILARHYEALGGLERLLAIETLRATATQEVGPRLIEVTVVQRRPTKLLVSMRLDGKEILQGFDGQAAWQAFSFRAGGAPEALPLAEAGFAREAHIDGVLIGWREKGHQVVYEGEEEQLGRRVHALTVTRKSGKVQRIYLDAETLLELANVTRVNVAPAPQDEWVLQSDHRRVDGVVIPFSSETRVADKVVRRLVVHSIEINPEISDALFEPHKAVSLEGLDAVAPAGKN